MYVCMYVRVCVFAKQIIKQNDLPLNTSTFRSDFVFIYYNIAVNGITARLYIAHVKVISILISGITGSLK